MTTFLILLAIVALLVAADYWGADSRDGYDDNRRRAWFIHDRTRG